MESIDEVIGSDRALHLTFDSSSGQLGLQRWTAELTSLRYGDDGPAPDEDLAYARIVRVSLMRPDWWDSLDAESSDFAEIGGVFQDPTATAEIDEMASFADALLILDFVGVPQAKRGARLSHALVHGVARIFESDIIALMPDANTVDEVHRVIGDPLKEAALRVHWERAGFVTVPGSSVMFLPHVRCFPTQSLPRGEIQVRKVRADATRRHSKCI